MIRSAILVLLLCSCIDARLELPAYSVLQEAECFGDHVIHGYELREYRPTTWVKTITVLGSDGLRNTRRALFRRLFTYNRGGNQQGLSMEMTAPVLVKIESGSPVQRNMTMFLMLPRALMGDPPTPNSPDVTVVNWPETQVYVRSFAAWTRMEKALFELAQMRSAINDDTAYDNSYAFKASYARHNEIWLVKI